MKETKHGATFFCTRPRLASLLISLGFSGRLVTNPYDPNRPAWSFVKVGELDRVVADYLKTPGQEMREGGAID